MITVETFVQGARDLFPLDSAEAPDDEEAWRLCAETLVADAVGAGREPSSLRLRVTFSDEELRLSAPVWYDVIEFTEATGASFR